MAKTCEIKIRVLAVERIMNSGRKLKVKEIQQALETKYGITANRETIFDDLYALNMFMPIESTRGPAGGFQKVDVLARCKDY